MSRTARRAGLLGALLTGSVLALAAPASAHVTVSADDASQGADDSVLAFRVPNEMDSANTVKLEFTFPTTGTPLASVKPSPKQGWTITTKTSTFATPITTDDGTISSGVTDVTYTAAAGGGIPVNEFDVFDILVGPLPTTVDSLQFPTLQTYANGKTVSWTQVRVPGQKDPDDPTPLLALTPGGDDAAASPSADASGDASGVASAAPSSAAPASAAPASAAPTVAVAAAPAPASSSSSGVADTALVLGIIGVLLGLAGVGFGVLSRRRPSA